MKPLSLVLSLIAVAVTAMPALSAEAPSTTIQLRYIRVEEIYETVKAQLGSAAASAVVRWDERANTVGLAKDHPETARVRVLISELDLRPPTVRVAGTLKRIIPATPGSKAREEILARPTVTGTYGKPMIISISRPEGTIEFELEVTPIPAESK